MVVKDLVKKLQKLDQEAIVVIKNETAGVQHPTLTSVEADEAVHDFDGWDLLSEWRNVKEMEDFYGADDSDPLAFVSLVVLS